MARRTVPKYSLHKPTGQARVRLDGKDHYLGVHGTKESRELYSQLISDWLSRQDVAPKDTSIGQVALLYIQHAKKRYRKAGKQTSEIHGVRAALRFLVANYRSLPLSELSPRVVKATRLKMIESGLARNTVNSMVSKIRRMAKWAVGEELCSASVLVAITAVPDLRRDEAAYETDPVLPVPDAHIPPIKDHVNSSTWGAIQFQLFTGARPGEAIILRECDIDKSSDVWLYTPPTHKTQHHGRRRVICIGPTAKALLLGILPENPQHYIFGTDRSGRKTPYRRDSYRNAISRACADAGVPAWSPNQLRHNFATLARKEFGIEAARVLLGHSSAVTSEIYAERDLGAAKSIISKIG